MKYRYRRRRDSAFPNQDFADALDRASAPTSSASRQRERKARQLCRQVQRALNFALAARGGSLGEIYVEDVSAAPEGGRLLVRVAIPCNRTVGDVLAELRLDAARLRCEVARAITRKRAPELSFVPAFSIGDDHG